ncbi:Chloroperoxidase [Collybia nuda]|uniref:Chloroperoxidase n=1 Tax=Collybia nuda TaxID=64659 RepID=A0A9P5YIB2_9AGAR|nr:Chloroperoxidase [Collybia nuda]
MSQSYTSSVFQINHEYIRPQFAVSRSPCPALNALANQGYLNRMGTNISFWDMLDAIRVVYNLSLPLAFFLTFFGFLTSGEFSHRSKNLEDLSYFSISRWVTAIFTMPSWTLNLESLSIRGTSKITHNASLVHPDDIPSTSPDPALLAELLLLARSHKGVEGLTLNDLGRLHAKREASTSHPLNWLHQQISLGECGLAWSVLQEQICVPVACDSYSLHKQMRFESLSIIPLSRLRQWFGEERLPDNWWSVVRPRNHIGLFGARRCAGEVARVSERIRKE